MSYILFRREIMFWIKVIILAIFINVCYIGINLSYFIKKFYEINNIEYKSVTRNIYCTVWQNTNWQLIFQN